MKFMMMINVPACASRSVFRAVLLLSCVGMATPVRAQMTVSSSGGISGEGQPTVGAAVGISLGVVRPELELAWARRGIDRRAATPSEPHRSVHDASGPVYLPAAMADVSTLMFRVPVPLRQGKAFEPFGSVGAGLARATRQPPPGESLQRTDTQAGIEAGGAQPSGSATELGSGRRPSTSKPSGLTAIFTGLREVASSTRTCCVTSR